MATSAPHAGRPARSRAQNPVLVSEEAGSFTQARLRPGKSARCVDQPMTERVAQATTQRGDIIDLVGDRGALRCAQSRHQSLLEKFGKRDIRLNSEHKPRWQQVIVSNLKPAIEAPEGRGRCRGVDRRTGIKQRVAHPATAVADVPTKIEAGPSPYGLGRRLFGLRRFAGAIGLVAQIIEEYRATTSR